MTSEEKPTVLTVVEQELLNDFLGIEGCFMQTILQSPDFSTGCKIIYLQSSISFNCHAFLNALDALYDPAKPETLNFIRTLKHINDLYFNHQISFQVQGRAIIKLALEHFFGKISQEITPTHFQEHIKQHINHGIESLKQTISPEDLKNQLAQQVFAENQFFIPDSTWRKEAKLPPRQIKRQEFNEHYQTPPIVGLSDLKTRQIEDPAMQKLIYFGVLSTEEFLHLTPIQFKMLTDYHINELLHAKNITLNERLTVETQAQIDNIMRIYSSCLDNIDLSFTEILNLRAEQCSAIESLTTFISLGIIQESLKTLLTLDDNQLENLRMPNIEFLILGQVLSFQEAVNLSSGQRQRIQRGEASAVVREIKHQSLTGCCTIC